MNKTIRCQTAHDGNNGAQKRTGEGVSFPCPPSGHLQLICDLQTLKRKRTKEEIYKAWKLGPDQRGYRGSPSIAKLDLLTLMSDVLEILHMDHEGLADGPTRFIGFYFAFATSLILGSEILSQKELDAVIRQINSKYGINLNCEWWLAFLDNYEVEFNRKERKEIIKWKGQFETSDKRLNRSSQVINLR